MPNFNFTRTGKVGTPTEKLLCPLCAGNAAVKAELSNARKQTLALLQKWQSTEIPKAAAFFQTVTGTSTANPTAANAVFTGRSPLDGLAGIVAAFTRTGIADFFC